MSLLAIDLGGTKLAIAVFADDGSIISDDILPLNNRKGIEVGELITTQVKRFLHEQELAGNPVSSIGVSVPGISYRENGVVWAPNIRGWNKYPLLEEMKQHADNIPITIESDRSCYILGESWKGAAQGCDDAIFVAVGTGIGAGIMVNGNILRGTHGTAGSIGWMALDKPYRSTFMDCGCFESRGSGAGIANLAREVLSKSESYNGMLRDKQPNDITALDILDAYEQADDVAKETVSQCIELWGMAIANLVSLFDPEKIILGGGVFGPAVKFIPQIDEEARKWAQPISMKSVKIESSVLGGKAGLYGAGLLALQNVKR
jgi:glucokinase